MSMSNTSHVRSGGFAIPRLVLAIGISLAGLSPVLAAGPVDADLPQLIYLPANTAAADHPAIIKAFTDAGFQVSTYAYEGEEGAAYARRIAAEIKSMISQGVDPAGITVVGSGMGSTVAQLASTATGKRQVNYVLLGRCDPVLKDQVNYKMAGRVIGIRDAADGESISCRSVWSGSPLVGERQDLVVNTGLGASLFNQPHTVWMQPVVEWGRRGTVEVGGIRVSAR